MTIPNSNKTICVATPLYPPEIGGPATHVAFLERALSTRGYGVRVVKFSSVRGLPKILRHTVYFFRVLSAAWGASCVYALDPVSVGLPAALAAWVCGKSFILRVPGDYAWEQGRQRFGVEDELDVFQTKRYGVRVERLRSIQKFVAGQAVRIIVPSEYMRRVVHAWGVDSEKVEVIYSAVTLPDRQKFSGHSDGFCITTAARLVPWKGVDQLITILALEKEWTLRIVGDGPERGGLEALARRTGVADRVSFLGTLSHDKTLEEIRAANVFVLNSTYEGLSHTLVETQLLGTPIVATNAGGNPEVIEDGKTGLLVSVKDADALRHAINRIASDPALRERLIKNGSESAKARFSEIQALNSVVHIFETV